MSKRLAGWVAVACLGWAGFAHALGLGEIESRSRLNQLVSASIPVLSASGAELDSMTVQLASNEDFSRAGIDRAEFLSTLRFTVENDVIRVTSKQIAREPFVSFLLDVRWSGGRLLREYTLLLDPPALAGSGISRPQVTPIGEAVAPSMPEPSAEAPPAETAAAEPSEPAAEPGAEPAAEPGAEPAAGTAPDAPAAPTDAAASAEGGSYGPVAPQETLWSIAYKLRPDAATITMDQMQVAIFNANPKAFHSGSIRGLMKGSMLRIPNAEEIRAVDAASAKRLVAEAREGSPTMAAAPRAEPEPAYTPPAEAAPPPPEPAPSTAETTPPPPTPEAVPPSEAAPPASETTTAPATTPEPAPQPPVETQPAPETKPTPTPQSAPIIPAGPSIVDTILESAKGAATNPTYQIGAAAIVGVILLLLLGRVVKNKLAQASYNRASKQVEAARTAPTAAAGSEDVTQVADSQAPSMQQALDAAGDAPTVVQGQKLSATVAMGSETMQQTMQQTQVQESPQAATGNRGVDFDVTSNFASETVQINLDAGDPLSEAEFHRAYGLYDEAALMLKQALQKDPNRIDARVKLAEIYFEAGKANEFVEVAKELKGQLPADKWGPIAIMGSQIAPSNDLFSGAGSTGAGTVDLSFDEPAAPAAPEPSAAPAAAAAPAGDSLEFDLNSLSLDTPAAEPAPSAAPAAPAAPAGDSLEFDLGSFSMDTPAPAAEPAAAAPAAEPAVDMGLDLGSFDISADAAPAAAPDAGGDAIDLSSEPLMDAAAAPADEAGTKLDLARAYLDMGDADMAKSLLNEVSQQGNDAQKKEAEELLKRASA